MGFDPVTLGTASLVVGALGTGVSVLGQIQSANAQAAQANYQAQVAKNNQTIAYQNKEEAAQAANAQAEQTSLANSEKIGQIKAAEGAGYIDPNSGSPADVSKSQREIGELGTQNVIQQGNLQQYGYASQATGYGAQAGLESAIAAQAPIAGAIGAGSSLLQGVSSIGSKYAYMTQTGVLPPAGS